MTTKISNMDNKGHAFIGSTVEAEKVTFKNLDRSRHKHYYFDSKASFSGVTFDFETINSPFPVFTEAVTDLVNDKRLLIIKGDAHFDAVNFSKQVAYVLHQAHPKHKVIELIENEENTALLDQFKKHEKQKIVILNNLHPNHIQYELGKLINISEDKGSFYIITTESAQDIWLKAGEYAQRIWYNIPENDHYDHHDLVDWFTEKLTQLPSSFITNEIINSSSRLSDHLTVNDVVKLLNTPQKLNIFLNTCRTQTGLFTGHQLKQIINSLNQDQAEVISKWFNNLKHDQKIVALSAALFNGLFCNQYFEVLTEMIKSTFWRQSSQALEAIDYYSLDFLKVFFRFEQADEGQLLIAQNPDTRVNILKTAIDLYPRHIEMALMMFSKIMQTSYTKNYANWDLYGTVQKRALLRQVFIETTRDIGINQLTNIESIYLELATSDNRFIQGIAAKSLAQYRYFNEDELLFKTVQYWREDESISNRMALFLQNSNNRNTDSVLAIKTMTIRTLAYAADYDEPNKLHGTILDHLIQFAADPDPKVQEAVADVLPKFIRYHSQQLRHQIFDQLMPNPLYGTSISYGLELAYLYAPEELKPVIHHWLSICTNSNTGQHKIAHQRQVLVTILDMLSEIDLDLEGGFTIDELYQVTTTLLKTKNYFKISHHILALLAHIQSNDWIKAYDKIPQTLALLSKRQEKQLIELWTVEYLRERLALENAPFTVLVNGYEFPSWPKLSQRPLTQIEETLFIWLNSKSKTAQKFAAQVFLDFAYVLENEEHSGIKKYNAIQRQLHEQSVRQPASNQSTIAAYGNENGLGLWLRFKIFLYLLFENKANRDRLKDIIKTFQAGHYSKFDLQLVIHKWKTRYKGDLSMKLAKWLDKLMRNIKSEPAEASS